MGTSNTAEPLSRPFLRHPIWKIFFEARVAALKYFQNPSDIWRQEVSNNINEVTEDTELRAAFAGNPERPREVEFVDLSDQFHAAFITMTQQVEVATEARTIFDARTTDLEDAID
jgi:hypothetical protein